MVVKVGEYLGVGLYTPAEAARLVRAHPKALSRWLYGDAAGRPVFTPRLGHDERIVTYTDLMQALAIRAVRTQRHTIPLDKIRDAIHRAQTELGLDAPLAYRHTLYEFDRSIVIRLQRAGEEHIVGLTGRDIHQEMMIQIVEPFMDRITYDDDGLAQLWTPEKSDHFRVVLNPRVRFGQPVIEPAGLLVDALADAVEAEGSLEAAAEAHQVPVEAVLLAVRYRDALTGLAA